MHSHWSLYLGTETPGSLTDFVWSCAYVVRTMGFLHLHKRIYLLKQTTCISFFFFYQSKSSICTTPWLKFSKRCPFFLLKFYTLSSINLLLSRTLTHSFQFSKAYFLQKGSPEYTLLPDQLTTEQYLLMDLSLPFKNSQSYRKSFRQ